MIRRGRLPWEYGVRNLLRRPARTALTLGALATVVLLVFAVVGFIRGLENSLAVSGEPDVVLVYSMNAEVNEAALAEVESQLAALQTELAKLPFLIEAAAARAEFARQSYEGKRSSPRRCRSDLCKRPTANWKPPRLG